MSKRAEDLADKIYPFRYDSHGDVIDFKNTIILRGVCIETYEQAEKDTIERAVKWMKKNWLRYPNPDIPTAFVVEDFKKAMEEE